MTTVLYVVDDERQTRQTKKTRRKKKSSHIPVKMFYMLTLLLPDIVLAYSRIFFFYAYWNLFTRDRNKKKIERGQQNKKYYIYINQINNNYVIHLRQKNGHRHLCML